MRNGHGGTDNERLERYMCTISSGFQSIGTSDRLIDGLLLNQPKQICCESTNFREEARDDQFVL